MWGVLPLPQLGMRVSDVSHLVAQEPNLVCWQCIAWELLVFAADPGGGWEQPPRATLWVDERVFQDWSGGIRPLSSCQEKSSSCTAGLGSFCLLRSEVLSWPPGWLTFDCVPICGSALVRAD
jgi:hypothetical protein